MKTILVIVGFLVSPVLTYFCVKFGVIAYYKAKQYIEKEQQITEKGTMYEQKEEE